MFCKNILTTLILLLLGGRFVSGVEVQVSTIDNQTYKGKIVSLSSKTTSPVLQLETAAGPQEIACPDIVEIEFTSQAAPAEAGTKIVFNDQSVVYGEIKGGSPTNIAILSQSLGTFIADLEKIKEIVFPHSAKISDTTRSGNDILYLKSGDKLTGIIDTFGKGAVRLQHDQLGMIDTPFDKLARILFARLEPPPPPPTDFVAIVVCHDKCRLTGKIKGLNAGMLELNPEYLADQIDIPLTSIKSIHFRNGRFVYLSDFPADTYEAKFMPYFPGDDFPPKVDLNQAGRPLKINGKVFLKGFGVYSRTELTFALQKKYKRFQSYAGIDDEAVQWIQKNRFAIGGSVVFQVYADGERRFDSGIVRTSTPLLKIDLDVENVDKLRLVVDYGDNAHCNDLADWAGARLIK